MPETPHKKRSGLATGALVLSIVGFGCVFFGPWGAIAGFCFGVIAYALQWKRPDVYAGTSSAAAAIVIGAMGVWFWWAAGPFISSTGELRYRANLDPANAAQAIGALRQLGSAERSYFEATGSYGDPACLREPKRCVKDYPTDGEALPNDWLGFSKTPAYLVTFHPGVKAGAGLRSYAAVAVPRVAGETGTHSFCADSTGIIRVSREATAPPVANGVCATSTPELR